MTAVKAATTTKSPGKPGRRRTLAQQAKDALAFRLYAEGKTMAQVADALGYTGASSAHHAIKRGLADQTAWGLSKDEIFSLIMARIHIRYAECQKIIEADYYHVAPGGKVAVHPLTGEALVDSGPKLRALQEQRQLDAMLGQYADVEPPSKRRVETITKDTVEAKIEELEAELGRNDSPGRRAA